MRRLRKIKVPRTIKKPFTQAEMEHLRCNAECQRDIAIMAFLYSTAARIGEVVRLNRKDIDWGNKEVIIYGEKGKKERRVYLTDDCAYHLHKYLLSRDDTNPALFVSNKKPHTRLGKQAIQSMLRALGQKTEIHAHPHKFRRTLLTDAGNRGIPLQEIQMYAGHQKPDTTMMYVTVSEENVRASFRRYIAWFVLNNMIFWSWQKWQLFCDVWKCAKTRGRTREWLETLSYTKWEEENYKKA